MLRKKVLFAGVISLMSFLTHAQNSRLQVIHNSADAAASVVDVYVNGTLLLDNLAFRNASPFINAPAGVPLTLAVAPATSASAAEAVYSTTVTLSSDSTYVAVANGIVATTGYTPLEPFRLSLYNKGREAASMSGNTDLLIAHGCTDAGIVDVRAVGDPAPLVNDIDFGSFSNYLELPTADYAVNVTVPDGSAIAGSFRAPLATLGLGGKALVVVASGFLDPSVNSNGPAFGLWACLPQGGPLIELPANLEARVQVIHNCADAAAATVDVYAGADLLLDNFNFRTASPFVNVPAGVPVTLGVAPGSSMSSAESIFTQSVTFEAGRTYVVVASGIVSATGYNPSPSFGLLAYDMGREKSSSSSSTDILVMHGCTDAPTVDLRSGGNALVDDISYGDFSSYLELPLDDYILNLTLADGTTTVNNYSAPLQTLGLGGQSIVALASGFLDPSVNSGSANTFGIWVALSSGGPLVALPLTTTNINSLNRNDASFSIYPNPAGNTIRINSQLFTEAEGSIYDIAGKKLMDFRYRNNEPVQLSGIPKGNYILQLSDKNQIGYRHFVKQ